VRVRVRVRVMVRVRVRVRVRVSVPNTPHDLADVGDCVRAVSIWEKGSRNTYILAHR
jgi:hypothetical protein